MAKLSKQQVTTEQDQELINKALENVLNTHMSGNTYSYSVFTNEERIALLDLYKKTRNRLIRDALVLSNLGLVYKTAHSYAKNNTELFYEYVQEGVFGLIEAAERFRTSKDTTFSTYATVYIYKYIASYSRSNQGVLKLPDYLGGLLIKYKQLCADWYLNNATGEYPPDDYILENMKVSKTNLKYLKQYALSSISLNGCLFSGKDESHDLHMQDIIEDTSQNIEESCIESIVNEELYKALKTLDARTYHAIELYYGLHGGEPCTLEAVGAELGVTRERARQLIKAGREVLRNNQDLELMYYGV